MLKENYDQLHRSYDAEVYVKKWKDMFKDYEDVLDELNNELVKLFDVQPFASDHLDN